MRASRRAVALMWIAAALLALGVSPHWRVNPDSALYMGIARSVATGQGYNFSGQTQNSIPPVVPYYFSLAYRLSGATEEAASLSKAFFHFNAFAAAAGMAGLVAAFFLCAQACGTGTAVVALLFIVTSARYFSSSIVPLTDVPYAALSWGGLLYFLRMERDGRLYNRIAAGVLLALAALTRLVGAALVAGIASHLLISWLKRDKRRSASLAAVSLLPAFVATAALVAVMRAGTGTGTFNYITDITTGRTAMDQLAAAAVRASEIPGYLFESVTGLESVFGAGVLMTLVAAAGAVSLWLRGFRVLVLYSIFYLAQVALVYAVVPRYFVPLMPIVYLCLIEGAGAIARLAREFAYRRTAETAVRKTAVVIACLIIAVNLFYIGRELALNFSDDFYSSYKHGKFRDYIGLAADLSREGEGRRVMALHSRVIHALSGVDVEWLPYHPDSAARPTSRDVLRYAAERGITELVIDPEDSGSAEVFGRFVEEYPEIATTGSVFGRLEIYHLTAESLESSAP